MEALENRKVEEKAGRDYYAYAGTNPDRLGKLEQYVAGFHAGIRYAARIGSAYPDHCMQPDLCRGKGYCPRDPVCVD